MILKSFLFFFTGFVLLFFQVHPYIPSGKNGIRPEILLGFVIYLGINCPIYKSALACFVLGYFFDVLSGANTGLYSVIYLNVLIVIKILQRVFNFETKTELFLLFLVCLSVKFIVIFLSFFLVYEYNVFVLKRSFFVETIYSLFLIPVVFSLTHKIFNRQNAPTKNAIKF